MGVSELNELQRRESNWSSGGVCLCRYAEISCTGDFKCWQWLHAWNWDGMKEKKACRPFYLLIARVPSFGIADSSLTLLYTLFILHPLLWILYSMLYLYSITYCILCILYLLYSGYLLCWSSSQVYPSSLESWTNRSQIRTFDRIHSSLIRVFAPVPANDEGSLRELNGWSDSSIGVFALFRKNSDISELNYTTITTTEQILSWPLRIS